jgi:hypothetical protein
MSAAHDAGAGVSSPGHMPSRPGFVPYGPSDQAVSRATRVIQTRPQLPLSDTELRTRISWSQILSPRFSFHYDSAWFPIRQAESILEEIEQAYTLIFGFTHEAFTDRWDVYVADQRSSLIAGHQLRSHVNCEERTLCLIQSSATHLYGELVQLLTHAMRTHRFQKNYLCTTGWASLEDAFSLFLNERISLQPEVFPFYGADPDLIAHHIYYHHSNASVSRCWQRPNSERSLVDLVLFGAFFLYLGDTFSDDRIIDFSKLDGPVTTHEFKEFFGAPLDELEHAWIAHLPVSLISATQEEQERMVLRWERAIDSRKA